MNSLKTMLCLVMVSAIIGVFQPASAASLKAGAAKEVITPEWPVYLGGYYYINTRTSEVHDNLHARALALSDGENTVVMISMDLIIMGGIFAKEIKQQIQEKTGVPPENITVSAIHTHTGPEGYYEEFGKYPKEYDPKLKKFIEDRAVKAAVAAVEGMIPAQASVTTFELPEVLGNRHDSRGPKDPTGVLLIARDMQGKPIAGFFNMASHPTMAPAEKLIISADWPGVFTAAMEEKIGAGSTFLFLQGASGNISPRGAQGDTPWEEIDNFGKTLSDKVWAHIGDVTASSEFPVSGAMKQFDGVPVRRMKTVKEFAAAINTRIEEIKAGSDDPNRKEERIGWLKERMGIENFMQSMIKSMNRVKDGRTSTVVQALRLGDSILVAFPGEAIAEVSIEMRRRFASKKVAVLGYTNDHLGYLTTQEVYEQGGYEAGMGLCYPEATYKFMDTAEQLASGLIK